MKSPVIRSSVAWPSPTSRGSSQAAPMSAPERPTRTKENRICAVWGGARRAARRRAHAPGPGGGAVEPRDGGAAAAPDREEHGGGQSCEREQPRLIPLEQTADDVFDIAARA